MFKKVFLLATVLVLSFVLSQEASAATVLNSGSCGDNLTYILTDDGILTIEGTGAMLPNMSNAYDVPWYAYKDSVTQVKLSAGVTSLGTWPFYDNPSLFYFAVDSNNPYYKAVSGVLYDKAGITLVRYPPGRGNSSYTVPEGVTTLGGLSFHDTSNLVTVYLPESLLRIEWGCFGLSGIRTVKVPDNVTYIGSSGFMACSSLESIELSRKLTYLGDGCFHLCNKLNSITIPPRVETIGNTCFTSTCNLKTIYTYNTSLLVAGTNYSSTYSSVVELAPVVWEICNVGSLPSFVVGGYLDLSQFEPITIIYTNNVSKPVSIYSCSVKVTKK